MTEPIKRGRKPKKVEEIEVPNLCKKRGRKPKGGKIVTLNVDISNEIINKPNIILHLKCGLNDITNNNSFMDSYSFEGQHNLSFEILEKNDNTSNIKEEIEDENKIIWKKIKNLEFQLHTNNISNKSACFWCTYDFENPSIYIPKYFLKNTYNVYGCFCSPECATAYLMNENIETSIKFERYSLLNNIYGKIYNYNKNIKPAPNPYYLLNKFFGNLTIQEYRNLLKNNKLYLTIDKPLTKIYPEIHEDNDEFILNNKIIISNYKNK
jgi:hypothetical protein